MEQLLLSVTSPGYDTRRWRPLGPGHEFMLSTPDVAADNTTLRPEGLTIKMDGE